MARRIFVVDDPILAGLPSVARTATLDELKRLFVFVGHTPREHPIAVQPTAPGAFPEALDLSDAVVRLLDTDSLDSEIRAAFRLQLANVKKSLQASGIGRVNIPNLPDFDFNSERLGLSNSIKSASNGFAFCVMAAFVTLPGSAADYVENSTQPKDVIDKRRAALGTDLAKVFDYFSHFQSLVDQHDLMLHEAPTMPSRWQTEEQQHFGVFLGRAMAHEARHLFVGSGHAAAGLGADSADLIDDKNFGAFSSADQRDIVKALHTLESTQAGQKLVPVFPQSARGDPTSFPF